MMIHFIIVIYNEKIITIFVSLLLKNNFKFIHKLGTSMNCRLDFTKCSILYNINI